MVSRDADGCCGRVAGHPLAQNELALHMFLQEATINKGYTPGKVRIQKSS